MRLSPLRSKARIVTLSLGSLLAVAAATATPSQVDATAAQPRFDKHTQVVNRLDNPRQVSATGHGGLVVAEAGHGSYNPSNCSGHGAQRLCAGLTGSVIRIGRHGGVREVMSHLLSGSTAEGTTGSDGASQRPHGSYYSIITYAPPDVIPNGIPGRQSGKLLASRGHGHNRIVANISAYELKNDPDGEGPDSDPYSVLALRHQVLVADAAGDDILRVKGGKVSLWALLPEYGKKLDAVPTVVSKGADGKIYVGELHSFVPGAAKVWQYNRHGKVLRSWGGFTTVTGVARGADGSLYVSELAGGTCTFDQIPTCFPGRVVRVSPNGHRSYRKVPLPAGVAVTHGKVYVAVYSLSSARGLTQDPTHNTRYSGALWQIFQ